jgi:hypothetical protein
VTLPKTGLVTLGTFDPLGVKKLSKKYFNEIVYKNI